MPGFLRTFSLDQLSFWLGFLGGMLFLWFLSRLWPLLRRATSALRSRSQAARVGYMESSEARHCNDTIQLAQRLHLAAPLFSLDEILIEPRLLVTPTPFQPGGDSQPDDLISLTVPHLPDWPELGTRLGARTISLSQALSHHANLILIGHPGYGKTVSLAHIASQVARREAAFDHLAGYLPLLIHVSEMFSATREASQPHERILAALKQQASPINQPRLEKMLLRVLERGQALLLLDGIDEVPPSVHTECIAFLSTLLQQYPSTRLVVTASPDNLAGLTELGLIPVPLAAWDDLERQQFLDRWGSLWDQYIVTPTAEGPDPVDARLINQWLVSGQNTDTPLELTLKAWGAYAGDALGPTGIHAIEAYLRRMTVSLPRARQSLEYLALQMVARMRAAASRKEIEEPADISPIVANGSQTGDDLQYKTQMDIPIKYEKPGSLGNFGAMVENGLLVGRQDGRLAFSHPVLQAYLAATALKDLPLPPGLAEQPDWAGKQLTLYYLSALNGSFSQAANYLERQTDPLLRYPLIASRWLCSAPKDASWRSNAMRWLANTFQREDLPFGLRARLLAALLNSGESGVTLLLHQMLSSKKASVRQLAALGCGYARDTQAVAKLTKLLEDPIPGTRRAACLALGKIGNTTALEALATALLHGDEGLHRMAAEALATHPTEGHVILYDGKKVDDLLVRRAVVFGLAQIGQPWTTQALEEMAVDDDQFVVRNAAQHALEELSRPDPYIPRPLPALSEIPWLIAFAGERGGSVSPGRPAKELLLKALKEGTEEQRLAAMDLLVFYPDVEAVPGLYKILQGTQLELREAAFNTLWHLAATGIEIPARPG